MAASHAHGEVPHTPLGANAAAAVFVAGALEGVLILRSAIAVPAVLASQFDFSSMAVMKMFVGAVGSSMLFQSLLNRWNPKLFSESRDYDCCSYGHKRVWLGASLLGAGMATAGSGPTMLPVQLGGQQPGALLILAGMLTGGAVYGGLLEGKVFSEDTACSHGTKTCVDHYHPDFHYNKIAPLAGAALLAGAVGMEYMFPHTATVARYGLAAAASPLMIVPTMPGVMEGVNQLPMRIFGRQGLGGATSIHRIVAHLTGGRISPHLRLRSFFSHEGLQLIKLAGALVGAAAVTHYLGPMHTDATPIRPPHYSFIGGFLALVGARIAGGCTCGHGVTGVAELALESFTAAASMFSAAIFTRAFLLSE